MENILFLQSDVSDPYEIYAQMLKESPVFWDIANKLWAIYSYKECTAILSSPVAGIPVSRYLGSARLNEYAELIAGKLVRLSNPPQHEIAKEIASQLFERMKRVSVPEILQGLIPKPKKAIEIDWVNTVCKTLPVTAILKGFDFSNTDIAFVLSKITQLAKIMLPVKTDEDVAAINKSAKDVYPLMEKNITGRDFIQTIINTYSVNTVSKDDILALCISNFIGLLIQSYDAGRGILSNSLLQILLNMRSTKININDENYFCRSVTETLRFDPPVHNTRRILDEDIFINGRRMQKGESVLVILASANRDPQIFDRPDQYNIGRINNEEHLTFGTGHHSCPAKYFSTKMTSDSLFFLFNQYKKVELIEKRIVYEPLINARLPKELFISLS